MSTPMPAMTGRQSRWRKFWTSKLICRENRENQANKCTNLLHHLPVNLRIFIKKCVSLEQNTKNEKAPESLKNQGLKAYEGIKKIW